ncbi:LH3 [Bearded dragon adenovirus 1]|uniref:LH3 n=1 Tax=Bearded dragon adenovirus 1 TaxID=2729647 RepID=A0A6N3IR61_9ADEN|nr:LH3 [Bearded dragon adenovirus 1]QJR83086.1 LH3 [Bearded dragon adenovirus 1]
MDVRTENLAVQAPVQPWPAVYPGGSYAPRVATLNPGDPAEAILNAFDVVYLQPGAVYTWTRVIVRRSVTIHGNGATVCAGGDICLWLQGGGLADRGSVVENVKFVGSPEVPNRNLPMSNLFERKLGIICEDNVGVVFRGCKFTNFAGAAVSFAQAYVSTNAQFNLLSGCTWEACRFALVTTKGADNSHVDSCFFRDCQVALYMAGGGWSVAGCMFDRCRCVYFHDNEDMWFASEADQTRLGGIVSNCSMIRCSNSAWPDEMYNKAGQQVDLKGFVFDASDNIPPVWSNNYMYNCDVSINDMNQDVKVYSITGCQIAASARAMGEINVTGTAATKVYLVGCTANGTLTINGIANANQTPPIQ